MFLSDGYYAQCKGNQFYHNIVRSYPGGGYFTGAAGALQAEDFEEDGSLIIVNNMICRNCDNITEDATSCHREAIYTRNINNVTLTNNTVLFNYSGASRSTVIVNFSTFTTYAQIWNNILWGNYGDTYDIYLMGLVGQDPKLDVELSYNDFLRTTYVNHDYVQGEGYYYTIITSSNNLLLDPNIDSEFKLNNQSQMINAGASPSTQYANDASIPDVDFEHDQRPVNGYYDIGADEYDPNNP